MPVIRASRKRLLYAGAAIGALALLGETPAYAQASAAPARPIFSTLDENGVDLATGRFSMSDLQVSVGDLADGGLARVYAGLDGRDNLAGTLSIQDLYVSGQPMQAVTLSIGGSSARFLSSTGTGGFVPDLGAVGGTLEVVGSGEGAKYTYTMKDGSRATFTAYYGGGNVGFTGVMDELQRANGEVLTFYYVNGFNGPTTRRMEAVRSNLGYMVKYEYGQYDEVSKIVAINLVNDPCDPMAAQCALANAWSTATFLYAADGPGTVRVTDSLGRSTIYGREAYRATSVKRPNLEAVEIDYDDKGTPGLEDDRVGTIRHGTQVWTYQDSRLSNGQLQVTVTAPGNRTRVYTIESAYNRIASVQDELGHVTSYEYFSPTDPISLDPTGRKGLLRRVTFPELNYIEYDYDTGGNVTKVTRGPKPGSGLSPDVTVIAYGVACNTGTRKACNQPTSIQEHGRTTNFTYSTEHGGLLTVAGPEPGGAGSFRPTTVYGYTPLTATFPRLSGEAAGQVYKLTSQSICLTAVLCDGTANQRKVTYQRQTPNLQVSATTIGSGDGSLTATSTFAYNVRGDLRETDGPLSGAVDTTRNRWNTERQLEGRVEVDPDGQSTGRPAAAIRYSYTPAGDLGYIQYGTVASQSDADFLNNFNRLTTLSFVDDGLGRRIREELVSFPGGVRTVQAVTQTTYNAAGRIACVAERMSPTAFASLPASACDAGPASSGEPDRITAYDYTAAPGALDRVAITRGVGQTAVQATETVVRTPNGQIASVQDGNQNITRFEYDGFDRPLRTVFPTPGNGAVASGTDFTQLTYNPANWDVTSQRLRNAQSVNYTYDGRGRLTSKDVPGANVLRYDALDRPTYVEQGGHVVTLEYDALGRVKNSTAGGRTVSYGYSQPVDRRTSMTWPDGFSVSYDYDNAGAMTQIREGATVLASFAYDAANRRQTLSRGGGVVTSTYGYDSVSRLETLTNNLQGSANDQTLQFTYNAAGQIRGRTNSNAAYNWTGSNANETYTVNAVNQLTTAAGQAVAYNLLGDLRTVGANTFGFDWDNRLTAANGLTLNYDGLDRLREIVGGSDPKQFVYDGAEVIAEYEASGSVRRRYVRGPGLDEPLVIYEDGVRKFISADERGSVTAISDATGAALAKNAYDEYGVPAPGNVGRFQYTGQAWLPEAGLYHYKARAYSPKLGRFLQPDPLGFHEGDNLYAYVGNDPVNMVDPLGLSECANSWAEDSHGNTVAGTLEDVVVCGILGTSAWVGFWGGVEGSTNIPGLNYAATDTARVRANACRIGNDLATVSSALSDASTVLVTGGGVAAGLGFVAGAGWGAAPGLFVMGVGGGVGMVAGAMQISAGFAQGFATGNHSNVGTGLLATGGGMALGWLVGGPVVKGYRPVSQRREDIFNATAKTVAGGAYDVSVNQLPGVGPGQVNCG